ncbi:hypothetical protein GQ457_13G017410 [Hibiscus cannabinus]
MTRANPRGPRFDLDPEIERTQKQLKRRIRYLMDVNRNNDGAIAPPAQQMNQQLPARTVRDYLAEDLEGLNPAVTMPDFEAEHFELKPEDVKAMHEAWERYRDLFRRCPMHGIPEWTHVSIFYNSVNTPTRFWTNSPRMTTSIPHAGGEIQGEDLPS